MKTFFNKDFRVLLPRLYLTLLLLGFVLTLLFTIYPSLETCSSLLGDYFCTPTGLFIAMVASIPGYLLVGNVVPYLPAIPLWLSLVFVFIITAVIYFALGLLVDKLFGEKRSKVTVFVMVSFIILLAAFLLLLARLGSKGIGI